MKRYRRKEEILVWQWTGDKSLVDEINEAVKNYNETHEENDESLKVNIALNDENILCVSHKVGFGTGTDFARINDYIVFDENNTNYPFHRCDEEYLNDNFIEI